MAIFENKIISGIKSFIRDKETLRRFRNSKSDFTKPKKLSFIKVAIMVLRTHLMPMQNGINRFFQELDEVEQVPTASAYCQARMKLDPEIYSEMSRRACNDFYTHGEIKRWKGKRLLGIDGSCINLWDTPETRKRYYLHTNGSEKPRVQGLSSFLYDLLNEVTLDAVLDKKQGEKEFIFKSHVEHIKRDDLVMHDRGYSDYSILAFYEAEGIDYLIRFQRSSFKEITEFYNSENNDADIEVEVTKGQKKFVLENKLPEKVKFRVVKVILDNGEVEILATSLTDRDLYPAAGFKELYHYRWNEESYFDRLKNIFEVERFSSGKVLCIEQEFYGMVFLSNMDSMLNKSAEEELKAETENRKNEYKINHSVSYTVLMDNITDLLMREDIDTEKTVREMKILFKMNPVIVRPGRQYQRRKLTGTDGVWHQKYEKRRP